MVSWNFFAFYGGIAAVSAKKLLVKTNIECKSNYYVCISTKLLLDYEIFWKRKNLLQIIWHDFDLRDFCSSVHLSAYKKTPVGKKHAVKFH